MKFKVRTSSKKEKRSGQNSWPITYRWTAIGTVVAYSAIGTKTFNVASAQSVPQASGASQTQAQRFDIASGPLSDVLSSFTRARELPLRCLTNRSAPSHRRVFPVPLRFKRHSGIWSKAPAWYSASRHQPPLRSNFAAQPPLSM